MAYIIILTWNGRKYIKDLLQSLSQLNYPNRLLNILVVDSGSNDGTVEYVERFVTSQVDTAIVHLIKLGQNKGFCAGNNIGLRYALAHGAEYLILLNQDTRVEANFLAELVEAAKSDSQVGVVQPLICYYHNKNEINSLGNELHYLGYGFSGGNHEKIENCKLKIVNCHDITYASAAAVLYKASLLRDVGLFDENYFAYHEDSDICLRAKLRGWRIVLAPRSVVHHDYLFPTSKSKERYFWLEKNRLYLIVKFYQLKTLIVLAPMFFLMGLGQLAYSLKNGYFWSFIQVYWWLIRNCGKLLKGRRAIQRSRLITDRELMHGFAAEIKFQEVNNNYWVTKVANPLMKFYWLLVKRLI